LRVPAANHVCLVATLAVTVGCATAPKQQTALLAPPAAEAAQPQDPPTDWQAMKALAKLASALDLPVPSDAIDNIVRWQLATRDRVHSALTELVASAGRIIPDLTVLAIEPVAHTESSGFGWRDDPIRHRKSFHSGTDFRGKPGTAVLAAGDGVVTFCGRRGGYGNMVDVDHGGGVITRYAHLRKIETRKDTIITAGTLIGQLGSTGRATGPHLHFEVRLDGAPVSPISALAIASLQRESPLAGKIAALSLAPEYQSLAESDIDPPKVRTKSAQRPERTGRAKRAQVLW